MFFTKELLHQTQVVTQFMSWSRSKFLLLLIFLITLFNSHCGSWEKTEHFHWKTNCFQVTPFFTQTGCSPLSTCRV